jgi:trimeric autotransporter adhesin
MLRNFLFALVFVASLVSGPSRAIVGDERWDPRFALGADAWIYAIAVAGNGDIYVGGDFTHIAGISANHVARWTAATNTWSALGAGVNNRVYALTVFGNKVYVGGYFNQAGGLSANAIASWDSNSGTWSSMGGGMVLAGYSPGVHALAVNSNGNVYAGGQFDSVAGVPAQNIAKWNGTAWSALAGGLGTTSETVYALAVSGNDVFAGGDFATYGNVAHFNGTNWSGLGSGVGGFYHAVNALALSGGDLYLGGQFDTATDSTNGTITVNRIARWHIGSNTYSALGAGLGGPDANAIAVGPGGVYVAGRFTQAGGVDASRIALWNGSSWSVLKNSSLLSANGVGSNAYALAVSGNDVYVGGGFTTAGSWNANNLARWNATSQEWYSPGNSVNGTVNAVAVAGSNVYVAGDFSAAGGLAVTGVARWDSLTNTWHALGTGIAGCSGLFCHAFANAIAVSGNSIYVGGNFSSAGGVVANGIARWDAVGSTWSALGGGVTCTTMFCASIVRTIAIEGTRIDIGGDFDHAGAVVANNIAYWNGSTWLAFVDTSTMINGTNGVVYSIAPNSYGGYSIGGSFSSPRDNYVYFDAANRFSSVRSAANGAVRAMIVTPGADIYLGGDFTNAAGSGADYIAMANVSGDWQPLANSLDNAVYAMTLHNNWLFVGGTFLQAGSLGASHVAKWDTSLQAWSNLGSGTDGPVYAVATDALYTYVGGSFATAGEVRSNAFGRWLAVSLPGAPSILRIKPSATAMTIYFAAPATDGGAPISGYTASCTAGSSTFTSGPPQLASPLLVSGLTKGVKYTCGVFAINGVGTGSESITVTRVARKPSIASLLGIVLDN